MKKLENHAEKFRKSTANQMFIEKSAYKIGVKDANKFINFQQIKKDFKDTFDYLELNSADRTEIFNWLKEQIGQQFVEM